MSDPWAVRQQELWNLGTYQKQAKPVRVVKKRPVFTETQLAVAVRVLRMQETTSDRK